MSIRVNLRVQNNVPCNYDNVYVTESNDAIMLSLLSSSLQSIQELIAYTLSR